MDIYAENILDHYRHPRHHEPIDDSTVSHEEKNLSCGDVLKLSLKIDDEKIVDVAWEGEGCAISQAAMSMLAEELIGKSVDEVDAMKPDAVYDLLGVPVGNRRVKCALLSLHTLKNTIRSYKKEEPQSWIHTVAVDE